MTLLLNLCLYLAVGCSEWYLALRRTLACTRGEKTVLVSIVFIENILGLWVLSNFIRTNDWTLALSYSAGGALGALLVTLRDERQRAALDDQAEPTPAAPATAEAEPEAAPAPALATAQAHS
jgi:hypothetical protein